MSVVIEEESFKLSVSPALNRPRRLWEFNRETNLDSYAGKIDSYTGKRKIEYSLEEWEMKLVEKLRTHPQLVGSLLLNLMIAQTKRMGIINVAPMGQGKSTIGRTIARAFLQSQNINVITVEGGFTPAWIYKKNKDDPTFIKKLENALIVIDDIHTFLSTSDKTGLVSFQLISQLVEAQQYKGAVSLHPDIPKANISVIASGTPTALAELVQFGTWKGHVQDRFLRNYMAYYNVKRTNEGLLPTSPIIPTCQFEYVDIPYEEIKWDVEPSMFKRCVQMFTAQFSENRAINYAKKLIKTHAYLSGRDTALTKDVIFYILYKPFIEIERYFLFTPALYKYGIAITGNMIYCDVIPLVLYWVSYEPQTLTTLRQLTKLSPNILLALLRDMQTKGYIQEIAKETYFVSGQYGGELSFFHQLFSSN